MSSQRLEAHFTLVHVKTMRALTTHRNEFTAPRVTKRFEISHVTGPLVILFLVFSRHMSNPSQGWRQEFSDGGLALLTRGLKYGFQSTINAKNLRKNRVSSSDVGL